MRGEGSAVRLRRIGVTYFLLFLMLVMSLSHSLPRCWQVTGRVVPLLASEEVGQSLGDLQNNN